MLRKVSLGAGVQGRYGRSGGEKDGGGGVWWRWEGKEGASRRDPRRANMVEVLDAATRHGA